MDWAAIMRGFSLPVLLGSAVLVSGCGQTTGPMARSAVEGDNEAADKNQAAGPGNGRTVVTSSGSALVPPAGYEFEKPVRIKAGDEPVSVDSPGFACPTLADIDLDGREDLVVGQFNEGHMQFCQNVAGSSEPPRFAAATWIMSGDEKARVPGVW